MLQRNNDECQFAVNMFKSTESSLKSQLDLLQKAIDDRKSFRSLNLLISRAKTVQTELDKKTEEVLRAKPHQSTATSILDRQKALTSRLQQYELEVDTLDDDGLLSQSSTRLRDDVTIPSRPSSRRLDSERSTPTRNVITEIHLSSKQPVHNRTTQQSSLIQRHSSKTKEAITIPQQPDNPGSSY